MYLYGQELTLTDVSSWDVATDLFSTAKRYELHELSLLSVRWIINYLTVDNVVETMKFASLDSGCKSCKRLTAQAKIWAKTHMDGVLDVMIASPKAIA